MSESAGGPGSVPESAGLGAAPSWGRRLVGIEGLRGVAATSVVLGHTYVHLGLAAGLGVFGSVLGTMHHGLTLFFALSGFLLYRPFASTLMEIGRGPPARRFLANRVIRIFPAYIVIFLLSSYVLQTTYQASAPDGSLGDIESVLGPITDPGVLLADLSMLQTLLPSTLKTGIGPAWSLTTELFFYLALPLLTAAAFVGRRRGLPALAAAALVPCALILTGLVFKGVAEATLSYSTPQELYAQLSGPTWHAVLERSLLVHADLFGYGAAAAVIYVRLEEQNALGPGDHGSPWEVRVRIAAWAAVGAGGIGALKHPFAAFGVDDRWETSVIAVAAAAMILIATLPAANGGRSLTGRVLEANTMQRLGLVSYSMYLWHVPLLWWLVQSDLLIESETAASFGINTLIVMGATIVLSWVTYNLVERPALRLKRRTDGRDRSDQGKPQDAPVALEGGKAS